MHRERALDELVKRLKEAGGANLTAVVLYGSAADHEFREEHSDLNILCLLQRLDAAMLAKLRPVGLWWWRQGHPTPLVFTLEELRDSADVFAIELLDMKQRHRMLLGEDFLEQLDVPMALHRLQVERELRTSVIRLRQAFLRSHGRRSELAELMIASASTFAALFRHSLIALGEAAPDSRRFAVDQLAARLGFDPAALHAVLDLREGKRRSGELDHERTFGAYLDAVTRVAEEMDRRLANK
jgi:predicted nucleotidyltransferase